MKHRSLTWLALMFVPLSILAAERPMLTVSEAMEIKAPPAEVWKIVKSFDGIAAWIPLVEKCTLVEGTNGKVGAVRAAQLKIGMLVHEELVAYREDDKTFSYALLPSAFPLDDYVATTSVRPNHDGTGSIMIWTSTFRRKNFSANPPEAESDAGLIKALSGIYLESMGVVRKLVE
jgi:uncharacterized protein YndB with AHSA1/START domain